MEGFRSVYRVFNPLPNTQNLILIIHILKVRNGTFGLSASVEAPAVRNTSWIDSVQFKRYLN